MTREAPWSLLIRGRARPTAAPESVECPYCRAAAPRVTGADIYPHRPDLASKSFFACMPCEAWVGCHPNGKPLGRLANAELRRAKQSVHLVFDPLWRSGAMSRSSAYAWLATALGIGKDECHIGMFDVERCRMAAQICADWRIEQHKEMRE